MSHFVIPVVLSNTFFSEFVIPIPRCIPVTLGNNFYPANTQCWFNVDVWWNNVATSVNVICTLIQRRFFNVDSSIKFNIKTTLILGWLKRQFCSHIIMLEKLKSLYQRWKNNRISTSKQRQLINVKSKSKFDIESTLILDWL